MNCELLRIPSGADRVAYLLALSWGYPDLASFKCPMCGSSAFFYVHSLTGFCGNCDINFEAHQNKNGVFRIGRRGGITRISARVENPVSRVARQARAAKERGEIERLGDVF